MMAEWNDMSEEVKVEEEGGYLGEDKREQSFVLLLRVTQANGKPLPIDEFTGRAMTQMLYDIAHVTLHLTRSGSRVGNGNTNNGGVKSSAQVVPISWAIHICR